MPYFVFFFFQAEDGIRDLTVTGVQTCALPIYDIFPRLLGRGDELDAAIGELICDHDAHDATVATIVEVCARIEYDPTLDRKSTRLNSSHSQISYAVFCLKKKKKKKKTKDQE